MVSMSEKYILNYSGSCSTFKLTNRLNRLFISKNKRWPKVVTKYLIHFQGFQICTHVLLRITFVSRKKVAMMEEGRKGGGKEGRKVLNIIGKGTAFQKMAPNHKMISTHDDLKLKSYVTIKSRMSCFEGKL